jgi:hypothetical protein
MGLRRGAARLTTNDAIREAYAALQKAHDAVASILDMEALNVMGPTTVFAIGETLGIIAKAKALVGRDIDDNKTASGDDT